MLFEIITNERWHCILYYSLLPAITTSQYILFLYINKRIGPLYEIVFYHFLISSLAYQKHILYCVNINRMIQIQVLTSQSFRRAHAPGQRAERWAAEQRKHQCACSMGPCHAEEIRVSSASSALCPQKFNFFLLKVDNEKRLQERTRPRPPTLRPPAFTKGHVGCLFEFVLTLLPW